MTVWLHFPTIGVEINISNGSLKFVKKIMQYHSFKLDLKCLEILECINEKICIIHICSNYTKCVFLKWAKSILTLYPCCIVCVCITSTQDASHRSRRKSCHYKNEKRKKKYFTHPYFVQWMYQNIWLYNGRIMFTLLKGVLFFISSNRSFDSPAIPQTCAPAPWPKQNCDCLIGGLPSLSFPLTYKTW